MARMAVAIKRRNGPGGVSIEMPEAAALKAARRSKRPSTEGQVQRTSCHDLCSAALPDSRSSITAGTEKASPTARNAPGMKKHREPSAIAAPESKIVQESCA